MIIRIWIDLLNPSHPLFFSPLIRKFEGKYDIDITMRKRAETIGLAKKLGIEGRVIGEDHWNPARKVLSIISRTMELNRKIDKFDISISFENPMSVALSKYRRSRSILLLDNDLKYKIKSNLFQDAESRVKMMATWIIIPEVCENSLKGIVKENKLITYDGYKEDIYIADYRPDPGFLGELPFDDYLVIRPEAMASFYVNNKESLTEQLIKRFVEKERNIVYLPRDKNDYRCESGNNIFIPDKPMNGLDLIYHSKGVLTGSGTMAREAAIMGKPSCSFFPNDSLLSVDQNLISKGKMIHSRVIEEIVSYFDETENETENVDLGRSKRVSERLFRIIEDLIESSDG